ARAPGHIIRDQDLMDRIYGKTYDIKRIAPGLMDDDSRGWATHDCTTLGGKSGSPVIDVGTGKVVALHFAGLYLIENYAVPVSTIKQYLRDRPWQHNGPSVETGDTRQPAVPVAGLQSPATAAGNIASLTIPVTISVSIGDGPAANIKITSGATEQYTPALNVEAAARKLWQQKSGNGILNIAASYMVSNGKFTDDECITVWAHPDKLHEVATYIGTDNYVGYPVTIEPASIDDQISPGGMGDALAEAVTSIAYNDDDRTGKGFRFDEVNEMMAVTCHVGPERSWEVLSGFLQETRKELISSIYQFHAKHIATVIGSELDDNARLKLVMDFQSNDPRDDEHHIGDFDRSDTFASWENQHGDRFDAIYAPKGGSGLVAYSYHIKVTVRDGNTFWLSSGNWKRHSQPIIPDDKRNDPKFTIRKGNREWHVVIENKKLAGLFRNHIIADFEQCRKLGGSLEAPLPDEVFVDVPEASFIAEAVELEAAAPPDILEPLTVRRKVKVKPLLTPDDKGAVYSEAVLELIRSAKKQLVFQNQYIKMKGAKFGFLKELVDALVEKSRQLDDFRLILRSSVDKQDLAELKKRGMDVNNQVRQVSKTHTKGIVVDGKRVLVGSHNWSASGVSLNRDASLIFDDSKIAGYFLQAFERDWARARQLTVPEAIVAESPRIAFRDSPVPGGFRRMRLENYLDD
ncbi:MAG: phospholipase D-like domain-containing protein, partial [Pseudomonadota bacterium]